MSEIPATWTATSPSADPLTDPEFTARDAWRDRNAELLDTIAEPHRPDPAKVRRAEQEAEWQMLWDDRPEADEPEPGVLADRYGWAEAEATKPDRYRTAQLDQADREAEL